MPIWILGLVALYAVPALPGPSPQALRYTAFVAQVTANKVATATISGTGAVRGNPVGGAAYTSQLPTALNDSSLAPLLAAHSVAVTATNPDASSLLNVLLSFLPCVLMIGLFLWLLRRGTKQLGAGGGSAG
jgi:cell division protease FtsH